MADAGKKTPTAGKDMKDVIAQFQQVNKGNMNLRPSAGNKPKPPTAQKHPLIEQTDTGNDTATLPKKLTTDKLEGPGNSATSETTNQFKVALKPVAKPSGTGVTTRNSFNQKSATEMNNDETPETAQRVSTSIANKSKMFETQQKQPEEEAPSKPTVGGGGATTKPKLSANSNFPKPPVVHKTQIKPTPAADSAPKLNGTAAPSPNKWTKVESKPDESTTGDQKLDSKKEFPFRKRVQEDEAKTGDQEPDGKKEFPFRKRVQEDEAKTGDQKLDGKKEFPFQKRVQEDEAKIRNNAQADDKVGNTNFATMRPVKTAAKASFPASCNTLPKPPKSVASTTAKATTENDRETEKEDSSQRKIPSKPSDKAEKAKIKSDEDTEQPKIPPRFSDKAEQPKIASKITEDGDQPKIPPRRDQKIPEEKPAGKMASKQPPIANRKADEAKLKKVPDVHDQKAQKVGQNADSLLRNKGRPLPKPAEKQYRQLPVPKQKGKPPRKMAKPPNIDLSKYASYATSKSIQPATSEVSEDTYEDGDDLYEDCDNMEVVTRKSSRISEYTEEEEAKMEMIAKTKPNATNTDNYGKMFNAPSIDEYDDDEIYQELD